MWSRHSALAFWEVRNNITSNLAEDSQAEAGRGAGSELGLTFWAWGLGPGIGPGDWAPGLGPARDCLADGGGGQMARTP